MKERINIVLDKLELTSLFSSSYLAKFKSHNKKM